MYGTFERSPNALFLRRPTRSSPTPEHLENGPGVLLVVRNRDQHRPSNALIVRRLPGLEGLLVVAVEEFRALAHERHSAGGNELLARVGLEEVAKRRLVRCVVASRRLRDLHQARLHRLHERKLAHDPWDEDGFLLRDCSRRHLRLCRVDEDRCCAQIERLCELVAPVGAERVQGFHPDPGFLSLPALPAVVAFVVQHDDPLRASPPGGPEQP